MRGEGEDRERGGGIIPPSNSFKARGANGELGKGWGRGGEMRQGRGHDFIRPFANYKS